MVAMGHNEASRMRPVEMHTIKVVAIRRHLAPKVCYLPHSCRILRNLDATTEATFTLPTPPCFGTTL